MVIKYYIEHPGELGAGIHSYTEEVTVSIGSGDPGGEYGEFAEFFRDCLAQWFDGAAVTKIEN